MAGRTTKKFSFNELLIAKIDEYLDQAFATNSSIKRQKYREAIRQMELLLLITSELEQDSEAASSNSHISAE